MLALPLRPLLLGFVLVSFGAAGVAHSQDPYALRTAIGSEAYLWELRANQRNLRSKGTPKPNSAAATPLTGRYTPRAPQTATKQTRNALNFWGGRQAQATLNQLPTRPSFVQQASATAPAGGGAATAKPFATTNLQSTPTVSPYLQLFRQEFEEAAPNYHAFVRPQLDQQRENRRLRQQQEALRNAQAQRATTASTPNSGVHSQRFGNTGSFYSGWQR